MPKFTNDDDREQWLRDRARRVRDDRDEFRRTMKKNVRARALVLHSLGEYTKVAWAMPNDAAAAAQELVRTECDLASASVDEMFVRAKIACMPYFTAQFSEPKSEYGLAFVRHARAFLDCKLEQFKLGAAANGSKTKKRADLSAQTDKNDEAIMNAQKKMFKYLKLLSGQKDKKGKLRDLTRMLKHMFMKKQSYEMVSDGEGDDDDDDDDNDKDDANDEDTDGEDILSDEDDDDDDVDSINTADRDFIVDDDDDDDGSGSGASASDSDSSASGGSSAHRGRKRDRRHKTKKKQQSRPRSERRSRSVDSDDKGKSRHTKKKRRSMGGSASSDASDGSKSSAGSRHSRRGRGRGRSSSGSGSGSSSGSSSGRSSSPSVSPRRRSNEKKARVRAESVSPMTVRASQVVLDGVSEPSNEQKMSVSIEGEESDALPLLRD